MAIKINLDVVLAKAKMSSGELAERIGITQANLSILKTLLIIFKIIIKY